MSGSNFVVPAGGRYLKKNSYLVGVTTCPLLDLISSKLEQMKGIDTMKNLIHTCWQLFYLRWWEIFEENLSLSCD